MSDPTEVSVLWLTPGETDALVASPHDQIPRLGLQNLAGLANLADSPSTQFMSAICAVVVNRTRDLLTVAEATPPWGGEFVAKATDVAAGQAQLTPPPDEMGSGASAVGVWVVKADGHNPSLTIKLSSAASTSDLPVYIGADISSSGLGEKYTVSVANDGDHGDALAYYQQFVQNTDSGRQDKESGHVAAVAWRAAGDTMGTKTVDPQHPKNWWMAFAVIG